MGAVLSSIKFNQTVFHKWWSASVWIGGHLLWTTATAAIVLAIPVFFEYERECQIFEQMQQSLQIQQASS